MDLTSTQTEFQNVMGKFARLSSDRSREKGSSRTASIPVAASKRSFSALGEQLEIVIGTKNARRVRFEGDRDRLRAPRPGTLHDLAEDKRCARWTPSKLPTLTSVGPKLPGMSSSWWKSTSDGLPDESWVDWGSAGRCSSIAALGMTVS